MISMGLRILRVCPMGPGLDLRLWTKSQANWRPVHPVHPVHLVHRISQEFGFGLVGYCGIQRSYPIISWFINGFWMLLATPRKWRCNCLAGVTPTRCLGLSSYFGCWTWFVLSTWTTSSHVQREVCSVDNFCATLARHPLPLCSQVVFGATYIHIPRSTIVYNSTQNISISQNPAPHISKPSENLWWSRAGGSGSTAESWPLCLWALWFTVAGGAESGKGLMVDGSWSRVKCLKTSVENVHRCFIATYCNGLQLWSHPMHIPKNHQKPSKTRNVSDHPVVYVELRCL